MEAELNALGDEFEVDVDTSYLDEALNTPGVPSKEPGYESKVDKEIFIFAVFEYKIEIILIKLCVVMLSVRQRRMFIRELISTVNNILHSILMMHMCASKRASNRIAGNRGRYCSR